MTYTRSGTPNFSAPLSRAELKVFTAIRGETSLEAVLAKTRLEAALVRDVVANLIARGLIVSSKPEMAQPPSSPSARAESVRAESVQAGPIRAEPGYADTPRAAMRWAERYGAVEQLLRSRVGGRKAEMYIDQLQNCASEQTFVESARTIARRLALIVDADVGKQLLLLLVEDS